VFSFKEFNDASKKNRKLALKEIFAKMLLRLKVRRAFFLTETIIVEKYLFKMLLIFSLFYELFVIIWGFVCGNGARDRGVLSNPCVPCLRTAYLPLTGGQD
jgi:hypothetical protein